MGAIPNFSHIPADDKDAKRHSKLLAEYGVSDAKAWLSRFTLRSRRNQMEPPV